MSRSAVSAANSRVVGGQIQFVDVALGGVGCKFAGCGLGSRLLAEYPVGFGVLLTGDGLKQHTMRDQIGIAANGRGEMQVFLGLQAVMSQTFGIVPCAGERTQQQSGQGTLTGIVLSAVQHGLQLCGVVRLGGIHTIAKRPGKLGKYAQFFRVRALVDAVDGRIVPMGHIGGNLFVGCEHEFLDHLFGIAACAEGYLNRFAALVGQNLGFGQIEVERAG